MTIWVFMVWVVLGGEIGHERIEFFDAREVCEAEQALTASMTRVDLKVVSECAPVHLSRFDEVEGPK